VAQQPSQKVGSGIPWTIFVVVGICVGIFFLPGLSRLLVYDRQAVLAGNLWRLLTCHFVHYSGEHLFFNMLGFILAGLVVRRRGYNGFAILCAVSAFGIGITLLLMPNLKEYGGFSGVVNAAIVFAASRGVREGGKWGRLSLAVLFLTLANSVLEANTGMPTFSSTHGQMFVPVPLAHLAGGLIGAIMAFEPWRQMRGALSVE
jgi:rhomboid family GlyGly-CTERM serine protease